MKDERVKNSRIGIEFEEEERGTLSKWLQQQTPEICCSYFQINNHVSVFYIANKAFGFPVIF